MTIYKSICCFFKEDNMTLLQHTVRCNLILRMLVQPSHDPGRLYIFFICRHFTYQFGVGFAAIRKFYKNALLQISFISCITAIFEQHIFQVSG